jgi:hypothetical protein
MSSDLGILQDENEGATPPSSATRDSPRAADPQTKATCADGASPSCQRRDADCNVTRYELQ